MPDIESIIAQMTLEEKAALCTGATAWTTTPIERLGVPELLCSDGPHGIRRLADVTTMSAESLPATCFPTASCQSATWNPALIEEMAEAIGKEAIALKVDVVLGPSNNMKRTPLCGRNFEYYTEDPYLSGELVTHYINGMQRTGVGTSLKHFTANNQEYERFIMSAEIDERTLREIYLPAFEMAVTRAKPWTVMCAYNRVNGTFCSEHDELLNNILKEEWGFEGLVYSDWGAVRHRVEALQGGLDLEMPGPKPTRVQAVVEAVQNGELEMAVLDESVRRILGIAFKAADTPKGGEFDQEAHHALARKVASEGIVLLKNDGVLPLQQPATIAVIGRAAKEAYFQGGGSSHINPTRLDAPFDELQKLAGSTALTYAPGYHADLTEDQQLIDEAVAAAKEAEVALLFVALPAIIESEGYDRKHIDFTTQQVALIQAVCAAQPQTVVIAHSGSAIAMREWIDAPAAVLEGWMMGQAGAGAMADILFGNVNPSGKLAETFPIKLADTPAALNFPGELGKVRYGEGLFIGYRYYDAKAMPVQFPFGYGLSYTTFAYGNLRVSAADFADTDGLSVSVDITNTGDRAGQEVAQLYVHDCQSGLARPPKELKGFAKLALQPGETKTATFTLDFRSFAFYHPGYGQWITEDGEFEILVGASSADIRCSETVTLRSTLELPSLLNEESTIKEWLADPCGKVVFEPIFERMAQQMEQSMVGGEEGENTQDEGDIGMDRTDFLMDMPLVSVLHFQDSMLPTTPEAMVQDLLSKAAAIKADA